MRMTGLQLFPARVDLREKHYHVCRNCDAWVGCKDVTWEPIGRLANAELRRAKQAAHTALQKVWTAGAEQYGWTKSKARNLAYGWLCSEMGMRAGTANIGDFDLEQCELVALICQHRDPDLAGLCRQREAAAARRNTRRVPAPSKMNYQRR
jgi:hypothetical protein